jgi:hypothetical protein
MRVQDFEQVYEVSDNAGLETALAIRYSDQINTFWLSHGDKRYPVLVLFVNGTLASLHYFPEDRHPGLRSVGKGSGLERQGTTTFFMHGVKDAVPILNDAVMCSSEALMAAREFLTSKNLPQSVEWLDL